MTDLITYELEITGELPLEFEGKLLFEDSNSYYNGQENNRYHLLSIYSSEDIAGLGLDSVDGVYTCFIINIEFVTIWQGENSFSEYWIAEDKKEIRSILDRYDPISHLVGYPYGDRYIQKQERLIEKLKFEWGELKIDALKDLGFKRKMVRPRISENVRIRTNVTIDPELHDFAKNNNINLSEILNSELLKIKASKS